MNRASFTRTRRFRYGSMSVAITVLLIAAVLLANVIITALAGKYLWYIDMTKESMFTVSDPCFELLDETFASLTEREQAEGEKAHVTIKFCDAYDNLMGGSYSKYVLTTALELQAHYPDRISVEYLDIYQNPSALNPYKTSVNTAFINTDVIVAGSGDEYRTYNVEDFFMISSGATSPFAYCGDKRFSSAILAVTQVQKPVVGILMGHGETYKDPSLGYLFEQAGYKIEIISDLVNDAIPEACRMLVSYQPTTDFRSTDDGISDVSEIAIIDEFLAVDNHSLMVIMSPECPTLPNIEKYLAQWGIAFDRTAEGESYVIAESAKNSLTSNGHTFFAQYEKYGMGSSLTSELRKKPVPQKTVFKNAMSLSFADAYDVATVVDEDSGEAFSYAYKSLGAESRQVFRVMSSSTEAKALAGGREVAAADANNTFGLMMLSIQPRQVQEDNNGWFFADQSSYVLACGSADFATEAILSSDVYGNSEVLMQAFYQMGKDAVPSYVPYIPFADLTIDSLTQERANRFTAWLTALPVVLFSAVGLYVIVRRKNK